MAEEVATGGNEGETESLEEGHRSGDGEQGRTKTYTKEQQWKTVWFLDEQEKRSSSGGTSKASLCGLN